jgi:hypothetical protein
MLSVPAHHRRFTNIVLLLNHSLQLQGIITPFGPALVEPGKVVGKDASIGSLGSAVGEAFSINEHKAKTLSGLLACLAGAITAFTCGQSLNARLDQPAHDLADLLVQVIARHSS